jgi:TonB-linked SusC/RagA family outer membrane protein
MSNLTTVLLKTFFSISLFLVMAAGSQAWSQASGAAKIVTGKVTDTEDVSLEGVNVQVKNKNIAAVTEKDGSYQLTGVPATDVVLVFTHVGYTSREVRLNNNSSAFNIKLENINSSMGEVVVIGYGSIRRKDLTGSVGVANVKDMQKAPVATFGEALAGRVAGVQVISGDGQPGADLQIIIRGNNSVTQDNSPLYVVDGFPLEESVSNVLNPEEIASIEVLKDASATAIYGARGANGVIIITTKKGKLSRPVVSYQGWVGQHKSLKQQKLLNPYEFVKLQIEDDSTTYTPIYLGGGKTLDSYKEVEGINWQDLVLRDALVHSHNVSVRGGNDKTRYSFSGSVIDQDGIILNSGFRRYQGRIVIDQTISDRIKVGINANYSANKKYGQIIADPQDGGATASLMYSIWGYRPVSGGDDGFLLDDLLDEALGTMADYRTNPYITTQNEYNPLFTNTLIGNGYLEYKPIKDITVRVTGGVTNTTMRKEVFNNSKTRSGNPKSLTGINGSIGNTERTNLLNENTITYNKQINKDNSLTVLAGMTMQKQTYFSNGFAATLVPNESLGISGLDEGLVTALPSGKSSNTLLSYLGRINYNFKSKYLLTASFRADGSSKFFTGNKWAYFPSGSFAWRIKEESFMDRFKWLSDAKLRVGYGLTGNNRVSDFAYLSSLSINTISSYAMGNSIGQGIVPQNLGNLKLKWETTSQLDMGIDLGFFNNRILFTADYYKKKTKDLLLQATLAPSSGYLNGYKNIGKVSNEGLEFTINTMNIQTRKFTWSTNFNIAFNRNRMLSLNDGEASLATRVGWSNYGNAYPYIAIPGHPIALFYGHIFDGVYQFSDFNQLQNGTYVLKEGIPNNGQPRELIKPGFVKYKDINGDGMVDSYDLTIIGNPNPTHIGGLSNNFTWKGFDLNIFFQWSMGNDLMNANRYEFEGSTGRNLLNQFATYADRWTPTNPSNSLYKAGGQGPLVYSSRTIEDGSFVRFKTLAVGYTLPAKLLKPAGISAFRVYAAAQNLAVWTRYSGLDPEVSVRPTALTPGFDWSAYPRARTITVGLDITF